MVREELIKRQFGQEAGFQWRGQEVSRLEGFSDAVFAFVITLLAIAVEVPKTFADLLSLFTISNVGSFAICFLVLMSLWRSHYLFFRRYGLQDGPILLFNSLFLFIVTLYFYPFKFLFAWMLKGFPVAAPGVAVSEAVPIGVDQIAELMVIFGVGFLLLALSRTGFYLWAYHKRDELQLNRLERYETMTTIGSNSLQFSFALLSILIALFVPVNAATWAGIIYIVLAPVQWSFRAYCNHARPPLEEAPTAPAQLPAI